MLSGAVYLPPHQFVLAVVLDFLVLIAWLLAVIFRPRIRAWRKFYVLLGLATVAAILYTPRHHAPSYPPPVQKSARMPPVSLVLAIHESPMDEQWASIVGGILPAENASQWTWTNQRAHLRFLIDESERWVFFVRFAAVGAVPQAVATDHSNADRRRRRQDRQCRRTTRIRGALHGRSGRVVRLQPAEPADEMPLGPSLRHAAAADIKACGVEWLLLRDDDYGAADFRQKAPYWGAVEVAREGDYRLWKLQ